MALIPEEMFADRIDGPEFGKDTAIYKFEKIKRAKAAFKEAHPDVEILDFGVGSHDGLAPESSRESLKRHVDNPECNDYADNGIIEFQRAAAMYMKRAFGVPLPGNDSGIKNYLVHSIGSKDALHLLPACFVNPGDASVMTVPGYGVMGTWTEYFGGKKLTVPLLEKNGFLPNLTVLRNTVEKFNEREDTGRVKLVYLNYPNNPTGADAPQEFYDDVVGMAHDLGFIIAHDAAYAGINFQEETTSPLLSDRGMDCTLAMYSMSKMGNEIPWRLGWVVGHPRFMAAYAHVKDNANSGQSPFIQRGACDTLNNFPHITPQITEKYHRRLLGMADVLNDNGFDVEMPGGTFFMYVPAPVSIDGVSMEGVPDLANPGKLLGPAEAASQVLLRDGISTVPWDDAGAYLRFSATFDSGERNKLIGCAEADERVLSELYIRLGRHNFEF
ncbi:aminotransferase class I/II-fold pyridoxal phosphate-dependent enzyme [Candidatus Woesearchaeota archaeon]|nr:aminotransferase class I/II-fold pyridoxal phosphate-dependent enzyme [Candidatus Woesearchaeota archaeon]